LLKGTLDLNLKRNNLSRSEIFFIILSYAAIIISSVWVAYDSSKVKLFKYNTGLSYKPWILCLLMIPLWYVSFPWYLVVRYKIKRGDIQFLDTTEMVEIKHGLKSSKGKLGIVILVSGIIVLAILKLSVFVRASEDLVIFPIWFLWLLYGLVLFSFSAVIFGGIYTLYIIFTGWLKSISQVNREMEANK
jgi:hypothetical protein